MTRLARIVLPGIPHHITQRGNNRQDIFFMDDDRRVYLEFLRKQSLLCGLRIEAYCLMTNHLHLIAVPESTDSLATALGRAHFRYAQYINRMHGRSGHLWQNRFFSCPLGPEHLANALLYVERNPVRAKMVAHAWKYKWSSAAAHVGDEDHTGLLDLQSWTKRNCSDDWRRRLKLSEDKAFASSIRATTSRGRLLGSDSFISRIEALMGRRLRPLPNGRPRKEK